MVEQNGIILREKYRLRISENMIPKRIFGSKRDENGNWRRLYNKELHSLYRSHNIVRTCGQNGRR
jgi:hypothetical protein